MIIPRARPLRTHTGILTYADRSTPSDKKIAVPKTYSYAVLKKYSIRSSKILMYPSF